MVAEFVSEFVANLSDSKNIILWFGDNNLDYSKPNLPVRTKFYKEK